MRARTLRALRREAAKATHFRGHSMRWSLHHGESKSVYIGVCVRCEMEVTCNPRPQQNEIDIGGEAVALNCPGYKDSDYPAPSTGGVMAGDSLLCAGDLSCTAPIRYIDMKGYVYCTHHGLRRQMTHPCRQLTPAELTTLQSGQPIRY